MRHAANALLALVIAALIGACGGDADNPPGDPTPFDDPTVQSQKFGALRASEEYQAAILRIEACLADRGIVGNPYEEGASMPDGTVLKISGSFTLEGTHLDYFVARERCQEEAGYEAILQRFGLTSQLYGGSASAAQINQQEIVRMQCMEAKGWEIPEPVSFQGTLVFDVRHDSPEDESAWQTDYSECWAGGSSP